MQFSKKDKLSYDGTNLTIKDELGEGGQGEVYLVNDGTQDLALKLYKERPNNDFIYNLKNNIAKGSPSKEFLWPKKYIEIDEDTCGYLMDIRPKNFCSFVKYLTGAVNFVSQTALIQWCINIVKSFKTLHANGFDYQDLNDGSFFLDPNTGDALICDNDNVAADKTSLGILGKMRYMAPEIVRGDIDKITNDRQLPDVHSDRFSLAVILFLALCKGNPFEGERLKKYMIINEKAEYELYGSNPIYIYHPNDVSNRPIRGYHTTVLNKYPSLPSYIKEAFRETFVDGLIDRENGRVTELEWIRLLCKYRDELIKCKCGKEYIYGFYESQPNTTCPYCHQPTLKFCYLSVNRNKIILQTDKQIYKNSIDKYTSDYTTPVGTVIQNKINKSLLGIRLCLEHSVLIKDITGEQKEINKDGVIPILNELKIKFSDEVIGQILSGGH